MPGKDSPPILTKPAPPAPSAALIASVIVPKPEKLVEVFVIALSNPRDLVNPVPEPLSRLAPAVIVIAVSVPPHAISIYPQITLELPVCLE